MGGEDNGLTLQGLAQRLKALERENAELRGEVAALRGSDTHLVGEPELSSGEGRVSRKWLLSRAGVAAVGVVAAGALTQREIRSAEARNILEQTTFEADAPDRGAVEGSNLSFTGYGVWGNTHLIGVLGTGLFGVEGRTSGSTGTGVHGINSTAGDGVLADSDGGTGVRGRAFGGTKGAVEGQHFDKGYGGQFEGGKAQLRLVPGSSSGKPTKGAHSKGELYMDFKATLWVCVKDGSPGTWKKVTTS
jgi:hypothetical protein